MARIASGRALWVILGVNTLVVLLAIRGDLGLEGPLSSSAIAYLAFLVTVWGVVIGGAPLVGDLRSGYARLVLARVGGLDGYVTAAVFAAAAGVLVVTALPIGGVLIADALFRPEHLAVSPAGVIVSTLGLTAMAASGAAVTALVRTLGGSRGASASLALAALLTCQWVGPPWTASVQVLQPGRPNVSGTVAWLIAAVRDPRPARRALLIDGGINRCPVAAPRGSPFG